jgi:hypothetical protein
VGQRQENDFGRHSNPGTLFCLKMTPRQRSVWPIYTSAAVFGALLADAVLFGAGSIKELVLYSTLTYGFYLRATINSAVNKYEVITKIELAKDGQTATITTSRGGSQAVYDVRFFLSISLTLLFEIQNVSVTSISHQRSSSEGWQALEKTFQSRYE